MDRNDYYWPVFSNIGGRSLRGNVDRNMDIYIKNHATRPVVPYVGTWIEIFLEVKEGACDEVVPYVGTWIEMAPKYVSSFGSMSFPTWERG